MGLGGRGSVSWQQQAPGSSCWAGWGGPGSGCPAPHLTRGQRAGCHRMPCTGAFLLSSCQGCLCPGQREACQLRHTPGPWPCGRLEGSSHGFLPALWFLGGSQAAPSMARRGPGCTRLALQRRGRKKTVIPGRVNMSSPVSSPPNTWVLHSENVRFFQASEPLPVLFLLPPAPSPLLAVELLLILQGPRQKTPLLDLSYSYLCHGTYHPES